MINIDRILCPVDFSQHSARALRYATAIARVHEAHLSVLHVEDMLPGIAHPGERGELVQSLDEQLRTLADDAGASSADVKRVGGRGDAVEGILAEAREEAVDLIVMGSRGRSGLARILSGSVAEGVVRQASCPVMTIPPDAEPPMAGDVMRLDPILCASDFSPSCRSALDLAISMAQEADARLILLHALQLPQTHAELAPMGLPPQALFDVPELRKHALARLKRGVPEDAVFRCRPEPVVVPGWPADVILNTAHEENVQLIVMGVQARGALDRLIFGSTTRRVIAHATCPVLSIRAHQNSEPWDGIPSDSREMSSASV